MGEFNYAPFVSVIVPAFNAARYLPGLIEALIAQDYPRDKAEYLIVDNMSVDGTKDILPLLAKKAAEKGVWLRCITEEKIQTPAASRNTGIQASKGGIIAFLDSDCLPSPGWLRLLLQPFTEPQIGIVAGEVKLLPCRTLIEEYCGRNHFLSQTETLKHQFAPYAQTANLAIRREALKEIGLFRSYLATGEDTDLCWRMGRQTSYRMAFVKEAYVWHPASSTLKELRKKFYGYGIGDKMLSRIYNTDLVHYFGPIVILRPLLRWMLKEFPLSGLLCLFGKRGLVDLLNTPIRLALCQARAKGAKETQWNERVGKIEKLI